MPGEFDKPPVDERAEIEEREQDADRLDANQREQKEMFIHGRAVDDERVFHPLNPDELAQRRLRRGVRPSKPKDDAA